MSAPVNSIIGAQSDSIGRGAGGSESGEESGSSESRIIQSAGLEFGSIAFEIEAPEVTSNRSSSISAVGSELRVEAMRVRPPGHHSAAELNRASRNSATRSVVARIRRRSNPRGCQPCSLSFQT